MQAIIPTALKKGGTLKVFDSNAVKTLVFTPFIFYYVFNERYTD